MKRGKYRNSNTVRRKGKFLIIRIALIVVAAGLLFLIAKFSYNHFLKKYHSEETVSSLYKQWEEKDYKKVYETSAAILEKNFLQNAARTFHGYSAFMLAVSKTDNAEAQNLLDEAIINLRIALQYAKPEVVPQIEYMLGRSYYYKDTANKEDHYYADLAIKYLTKCRDDGFEADDIPEYLGFSYVSLGETQKSIEAFSQAIGTRGESDTLFLSIAEQYWDWYTKASSDPESKPDPTLKGAAKQYLQRAKTITQSDELLMKSTFLLAQICLDEGSYEEAENQFNEILQKDPRSADAYYGLGLVYEKQGDFAKARAEWRKVLNYQPRHRGARTKLSESK
ncbi:MAG: tetratricopeptide repeat protein [Treponema sp.]|nr:tetratricopeptide repeat protein [Treponema sp.]MBQ2551567.1 tetratricopeptide repeat protein [Treponema sp.]MBQ4237412.1 tetratricopeptide repeat protein [Treponema sp.]MBQ5385237.1 tetratricopeptide repeat protein [Treponema sp.]